jgi:hypothetical protein
MIDKPSEVNGEALDSILEGRSIPIARRIII